MVRSKPARRMAHWLGVGVRRTSPHSDAVETWRGVASPRQPSRALRLCAGRSSFRPPRTFIAARGRMTAERFGLAGEYACERGPGVVRGAQGAGMAGAWVPTEHEVPHRDWRRACCSAERKKTTARAARRMSPYWAALSDPGRATMSSRRVLKRARRVAQFRLVSGDCCVLSTGCAPLAALVGYSLGTR